MSSGPLLGKDGAAAREYIIIDDSPERAPSAFGRVLFGQPNAKRRLQLELDHAKLACNAAHVQDRQLRGDLEEQARILRNEAALLRMRTVKYVEEKELVLKSWEQRHNKHIKEVRVMNSEYNQTCIIRPLSHTQVEKLRERQDLVEDELKEKCGECFGAVLLPHTRCIICYYSVHPPHHYSKCSYSTIQNDGVVCGRCSREYSTRDNGELDDNEA
jgi:hypothetical protein